MDEVDALLYGFWRIHLQGKKVRQQDAEATERSPHESGPDTAADGGEAGYRNPTIAADRKRRF